MSARIYGLDLSLTSTGLASSLGWSEIIKPPSKLRGHDRLAHLKAAILGRVNGAELVVVEGPSYGSQAGQSGHHERAGLWWLITHALWKRDVPVAVAPPTTVKRFATGRGNASKDQVLVACGRRFEWFDSNNDASDAVWLAAMGADWFGQPMVPMPGAHRKSLDGVAWPEFGRPEQLPLAVAS